MKNPSAAIRVPLPAARAAGRHAPSGAGNKNVAAVAVADAIATTRRAPKATGTGAAGMPAPNVLLVTRRPNAMIARPGESARPGQSAPPLPSAHRGRKPRKLANSLPRAIVPIAASVVIGAAAAVAAGAVAETGRKAQAIPRARKRSLLQ